MNAPDEETARLVRLVRVFEACRIAGDLAAEAAERIGGDEPDSDQADDAVELRTVANRLHAIRKRIERREGLRLVRRLRAASKPTGSDAGEGSGAK